MSQSPAACERLHVLVLLFAMAFPTVATWAYFIGADESSVAIRQATWAAGKLAQFALPLIWVFVCRRTWPACNRPTPDVTVHEERPNSRSGDTVLEVVRRSASQFTARSVAPHMAGVGAGLTFGLAVFAAMLLSYHLWLGPSGLLGDASAAIAGKILKFGIRGPLDYIALAAFYSAVHSLLEEYYWRWFVFGQSRQLMPWPAAALISSIAFAAHHVLVLSLYFGWNSWATWLFSLAVAVGGAVWCWIYQRSGSLVGPWLSHLLVDAAIFAIGYEIVKGTL